MLSSNSISIIYNNIMFVGVLVKIVERLYVKNNVMV
jgi:hypothetical protein